MINYKVTDDKLYRITDEQTTYMKLNQKSKDRVTYIFDTYGEEEDKVQSKLQTLYLFLRAIGKIEQEVTLP